MSMQWCMYQSIKYHVLAMCIIEVLGWYCNVISFIFINASIIVHRRQLSQRGPSLPAARLRSAFSTQWLDYDQIKKENKMHLLQLFDIRILNDSVVWQCNGVCTMFPPKGSVSGATLISSTLFLTGLGVLHDHRGQRNLGEPVFP